MLRLPKRPGQLNRTLEGWQCTVRVDSSTLSQCPQRLTSPQRPKPSTRPQRRRTRRRLRPLLLPASSPGATACAGNAAQFLIVASAILYCYGEWAYFHPVYPNVITATMKKWLGVPTPQTKPPKGRPEMVRPVYFILLTALPLFVAIMCWEFLRNFNVRRITSPHIMNVMMILRRKPSVGRFVSPLSLGEISLVLVQVIGSIFIYAYNFDTRMKKAKSESKTGVVPYVKKLEIAGKVLGLDALFNVTFLFFPATRNAVWMEFLNVSYANAVKFHRWIGTLTVLLAICHTWFYYGAWIHEGTWTEKAMPCFGCDIGIKANGQRWRNTFGGIGLLAFLLMGVTSFI